MVIHGRNMVDLCVRAGHIGGFVDNLFGGKKKKNPPKTN
jgi:hypothetical protein